MKSDFELPSMKNVKNSVAYAVTGKPTDPDCAVFGKGSGLGGIAGGALGLPPEWSEKKNEAKSIADGTTGSGPSAGGAKGNAAKASEPKKNGPAASGSKKT
ncbi:hypothetical protein [Ensifer sp. SL37]|nr:hypothetical protein [Ensifer sp. SL37]MCY1743511.1 hypothetical protein [Ensifer sp. SL37]